MGSLVGCTVTEIFGSGEEDAGEFRSCKSTDDGGEVVGSLGTVDILWVLKITGNSLHTRGGFTQRQLDKKIFYKYSPVLL